MRNLVFSLLTTGILAIGSTSAFAGRLDIAVIQFTDARTPEDIAAGLAKVDLFEITDSDRTETSDRSLRGGHVLFAQRFTLVPGSKFGMSTRIAENRADVSGSLSGSKLAVEIAIQQGVDVGLRKFTRHLFSGSGSIGGGVTKIISVKLSQGKTQSAVKGKSKLETYSYTSVLAAQYKP